MNLKQEKLLNLKSSRSIGNLLVISSFGTILYTQNTLAQIVSDETLPNNSIVEIEGVLQQITGGTEAGSNLFHSFEQFNLDTGGTAYFNNAITIDNIITRITGGEISNIDGLIRANGTANLFLINPAGLLFGANATLDIGGSFLGSTANGIQFDDGSIFSATEPDTVPLLTVSVPVGLQFGPNSGTVRVSGTGHLFGIEDSSRSIPLAENANTSGQRGGLRVKPGNTLALIGSQVTLDGGLLGAERGRIELGGVAAGDVSFQSFNGGWTLGYSSVRDYGDVGLSRSALLDASGGGGSGIYIAARQISMSEGSLALTNTQDALPGGDMTLFASESVDLSGDSIYGISTSLRTQSVAAGNNGTIEVFAPSVRVRDGADIIAFTFDSGRGGNILIEANDIAIERGSSFSPRSNSGIRTRAFGSGDGGDIALSTERLQVIDGAALSAANSGTGVGGSVEVLATDSIEVTGVYRASPTSNRVRSVILAPALGSGDAGNLTLTTSRLRISDGGQIGATTFASGSGGRLTINASESIEVSGVNVETSLPSILSSSALANVPAQRNLGLPPIPSGDAGTATINTPRFTVSDSARVGVENQGTGLGGDITINTQQIVVENRGRITAATASGIGGNLVLNADTLIMDRQGQISAEAGGRGNGGNISISTETLVALENSDITANAQTGFGGRVRINAQGIFGTQFRDFQTSESDITATSELGAEFNGVVDIQTPDVDSGAGLVQLSENPVDPTEQVVSGCGAYADSQFVVTGRGGIIDDPTSPIFPEIVWRDWQDFSSAAISTSELPISLARSSPLVEATGWTTNEDGQVELITARPSRGDRGAWGQTSHCQ